jgi:hypothetical protein
MLLDHYLDHAIEKFYPQPRQLDLRIQVGDCRIPCGVSLRHPDPPDILFVLQDQCHYPITGMSYERLSWLYRCVARMPFLTVIIHWLLFFTEGSQADFVQVEIAMRPMVKYRFASWGVVGFHGIVQVWNFPVENTRALVLSVGHYRTPYNFYSDASAL